MSVCYAMPPVRGRLTHGAPLAPLVWFKSGGRAEWLFEPKDEDDLVTFLRELDPDVPVMALGLGSNLIVRDGGVRGVVVRLGKSFAKIDRLDQTTLRCGGGASGILVSSTARDAGIAAAHVAGAGHPGSEKPVTLSEQPGEGMYFASLLQAQVTDGEIHTRPDHLEIAGATALTIVLTAHTGYRGFQFVPDTPLDEVIAKAQAQLDSVAGKTFEELRARQLTDHQHLFRRVSLHLGSPRRVSNQPTDQRLRKVGT